MINQTLVDYNKKVAAVTAVKAHTAAAIQIIPPYSPGGANVTLPDKWFHRHAQVLSPNDC